MHKNEPVSKVMTADVVTMHLNDPISKIRKTFNEHPIHHLPVVSGRELVGIISSNDLLRLSFGGSGDVDERAVDAYLDHAYKLADIMHKDPVVIDSKATVRDAARLLASVPFHSLPVVEGRNLVGIVTSRDLIQYLMTLF